MGEGPFQHGGGRKVMPTSKIGKLATTFVQFGQFYLTRHAGDCHGVTFSIALILAPFLRSLTYPPVSSSWEDLQKPGNQLKVFMIINDIEVRFPKLGPPARTSPNTGIRHLFSPRATDKGRMGTPSRGVRCYPTPNRRPLKGRSRNHFRGNVRTWHIPYVRSTDAPSKEHFVRSFAEAFVQVFSVTLPEIGSVVGLNLDGQPVIGSLIDTGETDHLVAEGPFKTIEEYLDAMIVLANVRNTLESVNQKQNPNPDNPDLPDNALAASLSYIRTLMRTTSSYMTGPFGFHQLGGAVPPLTLHIPRLLLAKRSAALPTYLAARYPRFLRSNGIWNPRFQSQSRKMYRYPEEWPKTVQAFENLREIFRNVRQFEFASRCSHTDCLRTLWLDSGAENRFRRNLLSGSSSSHNHGLRAEYRGMFRKTGHSGFQAIGNFKEFWLTISAIWI
ncbi:hypothetical protein B0H17DRAFT_1180236 [Mycena rosella]|uniref:Uncharacterized protein n=1 Tax=Mycena rosella TaxID=1033263 RepID=A0AAD7DEG0_MYCRO|nr:hypothetical protein B0H17DRAFT_1180236 [Mycena rosella]